MTNFTLEFIERFWSKVEKGEGCFTNRNRGTYGRIRLHGISLMAHHVVLLLSGIEIQKGFEVKHSCLNRRCINPEHLYQQSRTGRRVPAHRRTKKNKPWKPGNILSGRPGALSGRAKLSEKEVLHIREMASAGLFLKHGEKTRKARGITVDSLTSLSLLQS